MDEKYRILNRDIIKYIAMITMLLNHISTVFMEPGTFLAEVFLDIGYFTAITMCYFLVEGFHHTRSRKKYGQRLAVFALISEIPYCLAFTEQGVIEFYGLNMIFTLLLCFWILCAMENIPAGPVRNILIALLIFLSLFCDWALLAPVFTLLFAWARNSKKTAENCLYRCRRYVRGDEPGGRGGAFFCRNQYSVRAWMYGRDRPFRYCDRLFL